MTKDEALLMAIEALERYGDTYGGTDGDFEALKACEEALEQPAQEPVEISTSGTFPLPKVRYESYQWQGLSDDEIGKLFDAVMANDKVSTEFFGIEFARAIEQALKEKNV